MGIGRAVEQRMIEVLVILNRPDDHRPYLKNQGFKMTTNHFIQSLNKGTQNKIKISCHLYLFIQSVSFQVKNKNGEYLIYKDYL